MNMRMGMRMTRKSPNLPPPPPVMDAGDLAEIAADALVTGKGLKKHRDLLPVSADDVKVLHRITGESVERFNELLGQELGTISKEVLTVIKRKLAMDEFKTSELAFLFSVMHDKRMSMDGRAAVSSAAINVQINQYGSAVSKADLIAMLEGKKAIDLPGGAVTEVPAEKTG